MDAQNDQHQLNGYKYSFSRVNPYISKSIQSLTQRNARSDLNHTSQRIIALKQTQSQAKAKINQLHKHSNQKILLVEQKLKPLHFKHLKQLPTPIHRNTLNNTERLLYNKFKQNEKNKALIDLYLKSNKVKTNFSKKVLKNKLNPIHHLTTTEKQSHNLIQGQNKQLTFPLMPYLKCTTKHSTQQKHPKTHRNQSTSHHFNTQHKVKDKQNYLLIIDSSSDQDNKNNQLHNNSNSIKRKQRTITQPTKTMKSKNDGNQIKVQRNFSQLKFLAYLPPTKQYAKIKHSTSETTPVNKFSQFTLSNLTLNNDNKAEVRKSIGALKCKSPKIIVSSRNRKFLSRKEIGPKMKLFTEQQQTSIIKEFYSEQKNQ